MHIKIFFDKTLFELHKQPSYVSQLTHNRIINDLNINTEYYLHRTESEYRLRRFCHMLYDSFVIPYFIFLHTRY